MAGTGGAVSASVAWAQLPEVQESNGVTFISGGIGLDESQAIQAEAKNWPVQIMLSALGPVKAEWVSDVALEIKDVTGQVVFGIMSDGPLVLVKLAPGEYTLNATYLDKSIQRRFQVKAGQSQKLSVSWSAH